MVAVMVISGRDDEFAPIMPPLTAEDIVCLHRWHAVSPNYGDEGVMRLLEQDAFHHMLLSRARRFQPPMPI